MERDKKSEKGSSSKTPDDASIAFFKKRAIETADKQTPGLWQDLHSDLNRKEPLPIELATLLWRRLACEAFGFYTYIGILKINPEIQEIYSDFLHGIEWVMTTEDITPFVKSVYNVFFGEIEEYSKKHKEDISQTILKAKEGDTKAIYKLVKWDKSWIGSDFILNRIFASQHLYRDKDALFLQNLADAFRKKPGVKKKAKESDLLNLMRLFANRYDLTNNKSLKNLHGALDKAGVFDLEKEISNLFEFKYFKKQLKRHKII